MSNVSGDTGAESPYNLSVTISAEIVRRLNGHIDGPRQLTLSTYMSVLERRGCLRGGGASGQFVSTVAWQVAVEMKNDWLISAANEELSRLHALHAAQCKYDGRVKKAVKVVDSEYARANAWRDDRIREIEINAERQGDWMGRQCTLGEKLGAPDFGLWTLSREDHTAEIESVVKVLKDRVNALHQERLLRLWGHAERAEEDSSHLRRLSLGFVNFKVDAPTGAPLLEHAYGLKKHLVADCFNDPV